MSIDFLSTWLLLSQGYFACLVINNIKEKDVVAYFITWFILFIVYIIWNNRTIKKTSEQWQKEHHDVVVIDPDGWDRSNFDWSWHKERITLAEYYKRRLKSTCKWS